MNGRTDDATTILSQEINEMKKCLTEKIVNRQIRQ